MNNKRKMKKKKILPVHLLPYNFPGILSPSTLGTLPDKRCPGSYEG
jgi:hypothetical protein